MFVNINQHAIIPQIDKIVSSFLMVIKYVFNMWYNTPKREIKKFPVVIRWNSCGNPCQTGMLKQNAVKLS